ncbi:hypothetical protein [endosymbiont GvMRE of Glomus versiforme]|uniref:hypothetical protein n=1 Tax=endosymbiont GvMRE of Glomus versiforme TaxID=2039283 RepID=UPI000EBE9C33|nr:hypothetical protein [endosymbiont GvMRE of Glomus versiforme]RHZ37275.1 hypothetical protein GvMRE_I1g588 [endosymbiont GvMRE of Glomus versiforme]
MKNDKFISVTPKTYEVKYVENENKQSGLSPAARAKVINRSGSNYLSENQEGHGPCLNNSCSCSLSQLESQIQELQRKAESCRTSVLPLFWLMETEIVKMIQYIVKRKQGKQQMMSREEVVNEGQRAFFSPLLLLGMN